jgi:hypothetical protein
VPAELTERGLQPPYDRVSIIDMGRNPKIIASLEFSERDILEKLKKGVREFYKGRV